MTDGRFGQKWNYDEGSETFADGQEYAFAEPLPSPNLTELERQLGWLLTVHGYPVGSIIQHVRTDRATCLETLRNSELFVSQKHHVGPTTWHLRDEHWHLFPIPRVRLY